jgi:hypothetical protein
MAPHILCDDGGSQPSYRSKRTSARTQQLRQLSLRQAPALLRRPRHHTRKDQGPLREGWPRGDEDETGARVRPLAPSPVWTLVTPYCKRTTWARDEHEGRGISTSLTPIFGHLTSPFALGLAPTHLGWGTRRHFTRRLKDPPVSKRRQWCVCFFTRAPKNLII